jgi:Tfp pilus assembly protein PilF
MYTKSCIAYLSAVLASRRSSYVALSLAVLLAGCASTPPPEPTPLLQDKHFASSAARAGVPPAAEVFALSPAMQQFLDVPRGLADPKKSALGVKAPQQALLDALYFNGELRIDYDSSVTRNPADTFSTKSGNCLSLVLMTAAFAKALDLEVTYQQVQVNENWSRSNGMLVAAGHVNLVLGKRTFSTVSRERIDHDALTVDFFPPEATVGQRATSIEESRVIAMYMNNRAVELLVNGKREEAYWWARESIIQDAKFLPAYNTLGVIYRRSALLAAAEQAFSRILESDSSNTNALANLALVLREQNRADEAKPFEAKLARVSVYGEFAPFHFFHQGMAMFKVGELAQAQAAFRAELRRNPYSEEVHYWLARALVASGNLHRAREHLALAGQYSTTIQGRELYAAKRESLHRKN